MAQTLTHIGKYRIERELGRGAMGVVYKAFDPVVERLVAIKTIRLDVEDATELLSRLRREAKSVGQLEHPNIVTLYDAGESGELFYLAMQFIQGETLQDRLNRQRWFALREVQEVFAQICAGLDYAHQHGVIHRDIKPANIMITDEGVVKLTDFGIAKLAGAGTTSTGLVVGTPSYMSPEQALGKTLDGRSDLFSLGSILYEMMTGEKAFPGQNVTTVMYKIVHEAPTPLAALQPGLDPAVEAIVQRALAKHPDQRFQTCAELAAALELYINQAIAAMPRTAVMTAPPAASVGVAPQPAAPAAPAVPAGYPGAPPAPSAPVASGSAPGVPPVATGAGSGGAVPVPGSSPGVAPVPAPFETAAQPVAPRAGLPLAWLGGGILGTLLLVILILLVVQMRQTTQAPTPAPQSAASATQPVAPAPSPALPLPSAAVPANKPSQMVTEPAAQPAQPAGATTLSTPPAVAKRTPPPTPKPRSAETAVRHPATRPAVPSPPPRTTYAPASAPGSVHPPSPEPEPTVSTEPETYQAAMLRGDLAFQSGEYQKALAAYLKAYRLNPGSRAVKTKLRTVLTLLNRPEDAQKYQ
ncbi:MAG: protein kinase [Acidobacteriia bacterium]|nr:protein kinase [Terriglobia bacterium]